jgi:tetratricopeptide (TPR) repeat protein
MRDEILELEQQGRLAEAEARAQAWLDAEPDAIEARHVLGLVRIRRGAYVAALETLLPAVQRDPEHPALQVSCGRAALLAGDRGRARMAFEAARRLDPNNLDAYIGLAATALAGGDLDAAESGFRTALRANEDAVEAWLGLGQTLAGKGDQEASARCFNMALEIRPDDAAAQFSLAQTLRAQGYLDFALRAFERALELNSELAVARLQLAETLAQRGRSAAALQAFEQLREHPRYAAAALAGMGELALARNAAPLALTLFQQALARDAGHERAVLGLVQALERNGQAESAQRVLRDWLDAHPESSGVRAALAERLLRGNDAAGAVTLWREALARNPEQPSLRADLALALERSGDFTSADQEAEHAALGGRWPPLVLLRARAALRDSAFETARDRLKVLDEAKLNPVQRRHRQHLFGLAALGKRDWAAAQQAFLAMHADDTAALPALPDAKTLAPRLRELAALPGLAATLTPAPIVLVGLPGSGVHRLASLLARQSGLKVRSEYFSGSDLLARADDPRLLQPLGQAELESLARRYVRGLRRAARAGQQAIDWLPLLDARLLPTLKRALPGVRLLLAWRAPEACLLDWLAFGYQRGYPLHDVAQAQHWLQRAGAQLALGVELLPAQALDMEVLLGVRPQIPAALGEFLQRDDLCMPEAWLREVRYLGLPTSVPTPTRNAWLQTLDNAVPPPG